MGRPAGEQWPEPLNPGFGPTLVRPHLSVPGCNVLPWPVAGNPLSSGVSYLGKVNKLIYISRPVLLTASKENR